jgi:hypothetical protein
MDSDSAGSLARWSKDRVARGERSAPLLQAGPEARPGRALG